jgi:hypothetical protein
MLRAKTSTDRLFTWNGRVGEGWMADELPEEDLGSSERIAFRFPTLNQAK